MLRHAPLACLALSIAACSGGTADGAGDDGITDALINAALDTDHRQVGLITRAPGGPVVYLCTGTLIGTHTILSAGHCVYDKGAASTPDKLSYTLDGKRYPVARVVLHPNYDPSHLPANDVSVLELVNDVPDLAPLRLATTAPRVGERMVLVGFGQTSAGTPVDRMRRTGTNEIASVAAPSFTMMGASGPDSGVCHGDSGGPSLAARPSGTVIAGIHSTASCDTRPIVDGFDPNTSNDTRVDAYLEMIKVAAAGNLYAGGSYEQAPPTVSVERIVLGGGGERGQATEDVIVRVQASDDQSVDRVVLFVNGQLAQSVPVSDPHYIGDIRLGHLSPRADGTIWIQAAAVDRAGRRTNADLTF